MASDSVEHREGAARSSLVLLPGLDGSGVLFRPLIRNLVPELRPMVVAFPPDQLFGYEELTPFVLAALPLNEPFVLLGESFSGPLALMAAATRPPNLKGIILCASFVRNPVWLRPIWLRYLARPLVFRFFPMFSRVRAFLRRSATSAQLQVLSAEALSKVTPGVLSHRVRAVLQVNVLRQLSCCPVPILYLLGERDLVVPPRNIREIVAACPLVQVVRIPSSHWVLQTQPAAAAAAITDFMDNLRQHDSSQRGESV